MVREDSAKADSSRRLRRASMIKSALTIWPLLAGAPAWADNECGAPSAGQVRCPAAGNPYSNGITYQPSGPLTLTINSDTLVQGPVRLAGGTGTLSVINNGTLTNSAAQRDTVAVFSNRDATVGGLGPITNTADYGAAVHVEAGQTGGDALVTVGNVTSTGAFGAGIYAASVEGSASATGQAIVTRGVAAPGILVQARNSAAAGYSSIVTQGGNAAGVSAQATLSGISVTGGSVATAGFSSPGIDAEATTGPVSVTATAPITTRGDNSPGVLATSGQGSVTVAVTDVTTTGASSYGAYLSGRSASLASTGSLVTTGTSGTSAIAALVKAGDGLASIQINNVATTGNGAEAALASSVSGNASIAATGTVRTIGTGARGLDAQAFGGQAAIVSSGSVTTMGDSATALMAGGGLGATVTSTGAVTTSGANAAGIIADSTYAPAMVTATSVSTSGGGSLGVRIDGFQTSATATVGNISTTGRASDGLYVLALKGASVTAASSTTRGDFSRAIFVEADAGPISITSGNVAVTGVSSMGIVALASGPISVTSGTASSAISSAIFLQSNASTAALTVNGITQSGNADAVSVNATTAASLVVGSGGAITSATNAAVISGTSTVVQNAGIITGGSGAAIAAYGGPATVTNTGTITGQMTFKNGNDIVTNNGTINAIGTSDFGGGSDQIFNTGLLNAARAGGQGLVTFANLEQFTNAGVVSLLNGQASDRFVLSGNYVGQGNATLRLDVNLAGASTTADRLVIGGSATGSTRVELTASGASPLLIPVARPVLVDAGAGSSASAFVLAPASATVGFVQYRIAFDPGSNDYSLVAGPAVAAQRPARLAEGARNLWYRASDAWSSHLRAGRDDGDPGRRLWGQTYGDVIARHGGSAAGGEDLSYRQDAFGVELGYDVVQSGGRHGVSLGFMGGYANSHLALTASTARARYNSLNGGVYAGGRAGPIFVNLLGLYEHHWVEQRDTQPGYAVSTRGNAVGAAAEAGLSLGGDRFAVEPIATLAYLRSDLDGFTAYQSSFRFTTDTGLRGKLGMRVRHSIALDDATRLVLYASGEAVKEFRGTDRTDFINNGVAYPFTTTAVPLYGEGIAGLRIVSRGRISGFIEANGDVAGTRGLKGGGGRGGIHIAL